MLETETATRSGGVDDRLQKAGARDVDQPAVNTSTSARKKRKAEKVVGSEQPRRPAKSRRLAPDLNTLSLASAEPHSRLSTMAEFQRALSQRHPSATNAYYSAVKAKTDTRRTMLQHAWYTVLKTDPLADSDEECPDEQTHLDYAKRVKVITRLRGKPSTILSEQSTSSSS